MLLTFSKKFSKKTPILFILSCFFLSHPLCATVIQVTNNGNSGDGTLTNALQQAADGDIIDCSPIAGQTIYVSLQIPPIVSSITILGSGVTLDGASSHPGLSLAQGSATITDFIIQNGVSNGGDGGSGLTGGGGGTGGGGALFINSGATMTISSLSLYNNQAIGGAGGAGNAAGGSGGGGGGFGGGHGGSATRTGASAGSGGGGGGNNGGASGGTQGAGSPNTFSNYAGGGGGGEIPGASRLAGLGGSVAATSTTPAHNGGLGGLGSATNGAGAGGGAGSGGSGSFGSDSIDEGGNGQGGAGGLGVGTNNTYGAGGGGGGGNGGGAGFGTSGGGGGFNSTGGFGGVLGGGGGASKIHGGNGGFGAGGGAGSTGGIDSYGLGGAGGSTTSGPAGGGGGSGLGGAIFIQKGGALVIQDNVTFSGNSTTAGTGGSAAGIGSNGENGSSLGTDIFIQSGGNITFQINDTLTLFNPIEGAGFISEITGPGLFKSGTGTVNLTGANTYLGGTLIQSGTLNLNGSVDEDVNIEQSGTLSGNATITGNIYNNGIISPGNSIGEIFTTNLSLYPTSVYEVEVNSAGQNDSITASGFAQIGGGVLVSPDGLNFTAPLTYTIISTGTGVTGIFSSLTSSVPALMSLIYNPLTVQLTYLPLDSIGLTCNERNAANCFVTLPALPGSDVATLNNVLLGLEFDGIQSAFEQMGPAQFSGPTEVQLLDAILVRSTYTKHMQQLCCDKNLDCKNCHFWIDGIAQWQSQGKLFGYKDTTLGGTIGLDYYAKNWILGFALSSTHDHFNWKKFCGKATINSYYAGLYGRWNQHELSLHAAILGALNTYKTARIITFGTIERHALSCHKGNDGLIHLGVEYHVFPSHFQCTPYINLDYVIQHEHSYREDGAGTLDLHVHSKTARLFQGEVGISLSTICHALNGFFTPMLTAAYINQTPCSSKNYQASFTNSSCIFIGRGGDYKRNLFAPRLNFAYQDSCDTINILLYYDGQFGSNYWAQDVGLDITFNF